MLKLRDIMTEDVVTVSPDLTLHEAVELFAARHISGAPVVAGNTLVGVVSASDVVEFAATAPNVPTERPVESAEEEEEPPEPVEGDDAPAAFFREEWSDAGADVLTRIETPEGPEWNVLDDHSVGEVMTPKVCTLGPDVDVRAAADYMSREAIHRVLVVEGKRILGIVTTADVTRAVADDRIVSRRYVFGDEGRYDERGWEPGQSSVDESPRSAP